MPDTGCERNKGSSHDSRSRQMSRSPIHPLPFDPSFEPIREEEAETSRQLVEAMGSEVNPGSFSRIGLTSALVAYRGNPSATAAPRGRDA